MLPVTPISLASGSTSEITIRDLTSGLTVGTIPVVGFDFKTIGITVDGTIGIAIDANGRTIVFSGTRVVASATAGAEVRDCHTVISQRLSRAICWNRSDSDLTLWDLDTGLMIATQAHNSKSLILSPEQDFFCTVSDWQVCVWTTSECEKIAEYSGYHPEQNSQDGKENSRFEYADFQVWTRTT